MQARADAAKKVSDILAHGEFPTGTHLRTLDTLEKVITSLRLPDHPASS